MTHSAMMLRAELPVQRNSTFNIRSDIARLLTQKPEEYRSKDIPYGYGLAATSKLWAPGTLESANTPLPFVTG